MILLRNLAYLMFSVGLNRCLAHGWSESEASRFFSPKTSIYLQNLNKNKLPVTSLSDFKVQSHI